MEKLNNYRIEFKRELNDKLEKEVVSFKKILEIGCGPGQATLLFPQ